MNTFQNSFEKKYLLYHCYEYGEENEYEEIKILGIYSSEKKASQAADRYFKLSGFNKYPRDCFVVEEYKINEDTAWNEGFVSSDEIAEDFEKLTICFNEWLDINKNPRESWEDNLYYNTLCQINTKIYGVKTITELTKTIEHIWLQSFNDTNKNIDDYTLIAENIKKKLKLDI